jgi:hypothetical protein
LKGGNHIINKWIDKEVAQSLRAQLKEVKVTKISLTKRMVHLVKEEFTDTYRRRLMDEVEKLANYAAKEDAKEFIKNLAPDIEQIKINLDPSRKDASDPNYGKLTLEAKALERLLEESEDDDE